MLMNDYYFCFQVQLNSGATDVVVRTTQSVRQPESRWPVFAWRTRGRQRNLSNLTVPVGSEPVGIDAEKMSDIMAMMDLFSARREAKLFYQSLQVSQ